MKVSTHNLISTITNLDEPKKKPLRILNIKNKRVNLKG